MAAQPSWHFELGSQGAIGELHELSSGVSLTIPGSPVHLGSLRLGRLALDALVQVQQLPIAVGIRLDRQPAAMQPAALCLAMAQTFARGRSEQPVSIKLADAELLQRWGAAAAGSAIYRLAQSEPSGADSEEIVFLARPSEGEHPPVLWQLVLIKLFDGRAMDPIRWAMFNSALMGSLRWAPGARPQPIPSLWPASTWLTAGLNLELPPMRQAQLPELSRLLLGSAGDLTLLTQRLKMLACGNEPPHQPLDSENCRVLAQFLAVASPGAELSQYWSDRFAEVQTAHDLRGLALFGLRGVLSVSTRPPLSSAQ